MRAMSNSFRSVSMPLFAAAIFDPTWLAFWPTIIRIEHHAWRGAMREKA
jgi:hypothetical protein